MGPFFVVGHAIGLPAWVVQRLWWGTLLCLAFVGVVRLAERLELGDPVSRLVGGLAFALSPRVLSTLGPISVETLPYCLSPWVLLPLVSGAREGSTRRAAARSGVAVLCMGAVNAAAVLAALPPAALFLLTRERGPRRRSLQRWWVASVLLATLWWVVPLLLLGRYSPPFLDFIESASVTTSVTSLVEVLRGTSDWVAYVGGTRGPTWVTGAALVTTPLVIAYTVVVAALGLAGLLRRDLRERWWLTACLLVGLAAVTAGHVGNLAGPLAGQERQLLDGVLAPFRNVHKFEVDVRLPLVLGLVHLVHRLSERAGTRPDRTRVAVRVAAVAAVLGAALPALSAGLAPRAPFTDLPGYWRQTAAWLAARDAQGSALLLPASRFPDYLWGSSNDEPLQVLARSRWVVRNAVPLTPPGTIRFLDAVEQRLAAGTPSAGLADDLARAGVRYLVVRNDLDRAATGSARPLLVHSALVGSPGISRVATFGGPVGGGNASGYVDEALDLPYPAVEVYEVGRPTPRASLAPLSSALRVQGGPEALLPLSDAGLLGRQPVLLAGSGGPAGLAPVLTDGLRRREVSFGAPVDQAGSATLTAGEPFRRDVPAHDYLLPTWATATARLVGARAVDASSSASDAGAYGGAQRQHQPFAAVDGDPRTSWRSDVGTDLRRARWTLRLDAPRSATGLVLRFDVGYGLARPTRVTVSTDTQAVSVAVPGNGRPVPVPGLDAATTSLTVRTAAVSGSGLGYLGLADVSLPGLAVARTIDLPPLAGTPAVVLDADRSGRPDCYPLLGLQLCSRGVGRDGEDDLGIDRTLHLGTTADYRLTGTAVARPGPALDALLDAGSPVTVTASSRALASPVGRPGAVVDGDLGTGWRAASGDADPALTLSWARPQRITGLRLRVEAALAASRPVRVRLEWAGGTRTAGLDGQGEARFAPLVARRVVVHLVPGP
ncbi:MAG: alpha-(1-_3)-arabinofuranosyltransferase domain-containing protein, partial [Nocardioidaceae bacterium]